MIKAPCGCMILDNTTLTVVDGIITPVEPPEPTNFIVGGCSGVRFDADAFQYINGVITVKEAQDAEIIPVAVHQPGCGGLVVDGKYFTVDNNFGLSVNWDLVPNAK